MNQTEIRQKFHEDFLIRLSRECHGEQIHAYVRRIRNEKGKECDRWIGECLRSFWGDTVLFRFQSTEPLLPDAYVGDPDGDTPYYHHIVQFASLEDMLVFIMDYVKWERDEDGEFKAAKLLRHPANLNGAQSLPREFWC